MSIQNILTKSETVTLSANVHNPDDGARGEDLANLFVELAEALGFDVEVSITGGRDPETPQ